MTGRVETEPLGIDPRTVRLANGMLLADSREGEIFRYLAGIGLLIFDSDVLELISAEEGRCMRTIVAGARDGDHSALAKYKSLATEVLDLFKKAHPKGKRNLILGVAVRNSYGGKIIYDPGDLGVWRRLNPGI